MNSTEFGQYLKELRILAGLTLVSLGEKTGLSKSYLSHIENGRRGIPSPELLKKLAKEIGVNPLTLMEMAGHLPDISPMERERLSVSFDAQAQLEPQLEEVLKVITKDNEFIEEVREDIKELEKKYDNHLEKDEKITPQFLRELVSNFDWDQEWVFILVEDFAAIARKHNHFNVVNQVQLAIQAKENYKNDISTPIYLNKKNEGNFYFIKDNGRVDKNLQLKIQEVIKILLREDD